jgi:biotin transporter BioY
MELAAGTGARLAGPEAGMGFLVTIFIVVCAVIGWFKSRGRGGGSWWRLLRAMGWGLVLLPVTLIGLWLFGLNLVTIGLLLLCGGVLVLQPGNRTASRHHG